MNVALIPARAGSKSIINKNLKVLGGKSLVERAVAGARDLDLFDRVVVSTDIEAVFEIYKDDKRVELLARPAHLATDDAVMADVVEDVIERSRLPDSAYLWLLQPTSPFRLASDFREIAKILRRDGVQSVISVVNVGDNHPNRMYTIKNARLYPLKFTNFDNKQGLKEIYIRNGCFYVVNVGAFRKEKSFFLKTCVPYEMDEYRSINIDGKLDLLLAQSVVRTGTCR